MGAIECLAFTDATVVIVDAASKTQFSKARYSYSTVNHNTDTVNQARYRYSQSRYSFQRQVLDVIRAMGAFAVPPV